MSANPLVKTVRQTLEIMMGALVMLHLTPLIPFAGAASYGPLNDVRVIDRNIVRLSDVFTQISPEKDQPIGPAPRPGQDMVLNARTLMKLAMAYQVKWEPASIEDQVTLRREGTVIDGPAIEAAVQDALIKGGAPEKFDIVFTRAPVPFVLQKGADTTLNISDVAFQAETGVFSLRATPASRPNQTATLNGRIEPLIDVPVAALTIPKGKTIQASDLTTTTIKSALVKGALILDAQTLVGQTARQNILAGRPLKSNDVESPLSLSRGDKVTLIYKTGVLELSAQGRALEDGHNGDRVRVVNIDSNKNLQGIVVGAGRVAID